MNEGRKRLEQIYPNNEVLMSWSTELQPTWRGMVYKKKKKWERKKQIKDCHNKSMSQATVADTYVAYVSCPFTAFLGATTTDKAEGW